MTERLNWTELKCMFNFFNTIILLFLVRVMLKNHIFRWKTELRPEKLYIVHACSPWVWRKNNENRSIHHWCQIDTEYDWGTSLFSNIVAYLLQLLKTEWKFFKKWKTNYIWSSNSIFEYFQRKQNTILETHMHPYIHCNIKKNDLL